MADDAGRQPPPADGDDLQFDRVVDPNAPDAATGTAVCAACRTPLRTEYYDINGHVFCDRCRRSVEAAAEMPRGAIPLLIAGAFGLGAGIVGAAIYYAVIAIAHLEIGIVAILIGYLVGYAVRRGARGRGGRRFQVLAVALTYASIALAYTPIAIRELAGDRRSGQSSAASTATGVSRGSADRNVDGVTVSDNPPRRVGGVGAFAILAAFVLALPILVIVGSLPSGLISAVIIFIGMRQAWRMTGAPHIQVRGPYRVGAAPSPAP